MVKKFFVIAGEASGDILGSKLIKEIKIHFKNKGKQVEFVGVGGKLMKEQGLKSIFPMEELSIMGFFEVLPHIFKILKRIKETAQKIRQEKPDYVITIDSPDFCFRVIKKIQDLKVKKIHLIAPSVWAYRAGRAKKIAKIYDLLLAILPFEPPYFEKHQLRTKFIGHPIIEKSPDFSLKEVKNAEFRKSNKIKTDDILLLLTPGSRISEVNKIFPEFIGAVNILAQKNKKLKIVIPITNKTRNLVTKMSKQLNLDYILVEEIKKEEALFASNYALAKSGTNNLEISLFKIPLIIAYKVNYLTYLLLRILIKVKFANLINLILNQEIIPEKLQQKCNKKELANSLEELINDKNLSQFQISRSQEALKVMGLGSKLTASEKAVAEILKI